MIQQIEDPDVRFLASLSSTLTADYQPAPDDPWIGSPFEWIRKESSRRRGAIGERLVAGWAASRGFDVTGSPTSHADRIIHGYRVEVKFSTLWKSGQYVFQQIRDQDYDAVFCLGLAPFDAQAWLLPKAVLNEFVIGHAGQHTGAAANDTFWLRFPAADPPVWMAPYGGRLRDVERLLARERGPHQQAPTGHSGR